MATGSRELTDLLLDNNRLGQITSAMLQGVFLEGGYMNILDLRKNHIRAIEPGSFQSIGERSLTSTLHLQYNSISVVAKGIFGGLDELEDALDLSFSTITRVENGAFRDLFQLHSLFMSSNQLPQLLPGMFTIGYNVGVFAEVGRGYAAFVPPYFLFSYHISVYMGQSRFTGVFFHTNTVKYWKRCSN